MAPVVPKNDETKQKIKERLEHSFLFNSLEPKELNIVIEAMNEFRFQKDGKVIVEGDDGDYLYVVESGTLRCTKVFPGQENPTFFKNYQPGEAFGELALLYNAPRAASITANEECLLWGLDRNTFNHIVKDAAIRKREMYEEFLKKVPLLSNMDSYERTTLADALIKKTFSQGDIVIKEGDSGDTFYFVVEGHADAIKKIDG